MPRAKPRKSFRRIDQLTPQFILERLVIRLEGSAAKVNYKALETRDFTIDIALPDIKLGIEIDGWQYHGKYIEGFKRDRIKDRLMLLAGWRIIRFFASEVTTAPGDCEDEIIQMIAMLRTGVI